MEILTPQVEEISGGNPQNVSKDTIGTNINLKNLEFLNYLGMKDEMFNSSAMEKVGYLADNISDIKELQNLDWKVGTDENMPRIDRIYSYLKLDLESKEQEHRLNLINQAKQRYVK